jgi:glutamine amidotransferase-like uncharacterized protein
VRPYLEKTHHQKRAGGVARGVSPEFKPQYCQEEKKKLETVQVEIVGQSSKRGELSKREAFPRVY